MLTEQRYAFILNMLKEKGSVTAAELKELLHASESTVRRDITALASAGRLTKVFGGAVALDETYIVKEATVDQKKEVKSEEKRILAKHAASLVEPDDFVYLDAGTTTGYMLEYLKEHSATYVTNAVSHAQKLARDGFKALLIGGELKSSTEAVIGSLAIVYLKNYHFTKAFMGANGISKKAGFTTPDLKEALVKKTAMEQAETSYVLADASKFGSIAPVTFADYKGVKVLACGKLPDSFLEDDNIFILN